MAKVFDAAWRTFLCYFAVLNLRLGARQERAWKGRKKTAARAQL